MGAGMTTKTQEFDTIANRFWRTQQYVAQAVSYLREICPGHPAIRHLLEAEKTLSESTFSDDRLSIVYRA